MTPLCRRRGTAPTEPHDADVIRWAEQNALPFYYASEPALPPRCLKVHLGHITAYFGQGKLVRLWVHADGEYLDEVFCQLTRLFELCARTGKYLEQHDVPGLTPSLAT
jgi:hypothetical protein